MTGIPLSTESLAALLLIAGALLPIGIGIGLALTGNLAGMYAGPEETGISLPLRRWTFRLANLAMLLALLGFAALTSLQHAEGERVLSILALVGFVVAAMGWFVELTVTSSVGEIAARGVVETGEVPGYWEPIRHWVNVSLQQLYVFIGLISIAIYGWSLLQTALTPAWAAWIPIGWAILWLAIELLTGLTIPAVFLVISAVMGVGLLVKS